MRPVVGEGDVMSIDSELLAFFAELDEDLFEQENGAWVVFHILPIQILPNTIIPQILHKNAKNLMNSLFILFISIPGQSWPDTLTK